MTYNVSGGTLNLALSVYLCVNVTQMMDFGFHSTLSRAILTQVSTDNNVLQSRQACLDAVNHQLRDLDQRSDKQAFLEASGQLFSQPQLFEFQPHRGDDVSCQCRRLCRQNGVSTVY